MNQLNDNLELLSFIKEKLKAFNIQSQEGIIAGGSICAWVNEFIHKVPAVINDIDIFNVELDSQLKESRITKSTKEDIFNFIDITLPLKKDNESTEMALLKAFDLNCTQCAYSIKEEKLSHTEAFKAWIEKREIHIVYTSNSFPLGSILRAHRKAKELESKYYHQDDIKMYLWLYRAVFCFNSLNETFPLLNDDTNVLGFFVKNKDMPYLKENAHIIEPHLKKFPAQDFKETVYTDIAFYSENNVNLCLESGTEQLFKNFSKKIEKNKFNKCSSFFKLHSEINKYNFILLYKLKWSLYELLNFYWLLDKENYLVIGHWEVLIKNNFQSDYFSNKEISCNRDEFVSYLKNKDYANIINTIKQIVNYEFKDNELVSKMELPSHLSFARELTTIKELRDEGILMNHCVGGYTQLVKNAHSKIFHIRSEDEDSTVEFNQMLSLNEEFVNDKLVWSVNQHKAKYNREPSNKNKELVKALMKHLNSSI